MHGLAVLIVRIAMSALLSRLGLHERTFDEVRLYALHQILGPRSITSPSAS